MEGLQIVRLRRWEPLLFNGFALEVIAHQGHGKLSNVLKNNSRIFISGHRGLVGSALLRALKREGFEQVLTVGREQLDLQDQRAVSDWFDEHRPEFVIHAAGKVGGIQANSQYPADFLYENTLIHATVLHAARETGVEKLLYLGSSCIYPRECPQPMKEEYLLTGPLEQTNYAYAIAKITGLLACRAYRQQYGCDFISAMPTNLYGPGDNFHPENSHVVPAMIRRFHQAKLAGDGVVSVWGTGRPLREFLYVDDLARACLFLLREYSDDKTINVGSGVELSIRELAETVRDIIYPGCEIRFDTSKPDGSPRKLLDSSRLQAMGWSPQTELAAGINQAYAWFLQSRWNKQAVCRRQSTIE